MSRVEAVTAAVYHAAPVHLNLFDSLQARLLSHMGLSESTAFLDFNLAPLVVRRDIAMLGVIHKCVLGITHKSLCDLFPLAPTGHRFPTSFASTLHNKQLLDRCDGSQTEVLQRSIFGLVRVYNLLPQVIIDLSCVKSFQGALTEMVRIRCRDAAVGWQFTFHRSAKEMQRPRL